ncbi:MAG: polysaccharide deacetylase family protein [Clostridia bacterium]|nr:polysaccharide deacetylase family protein [Clostridia bacterium]
MKIYALRLKDIIRFFVAVGIMACALIAVKNSDLNIVSAFSPEKELPIYSVECQEKKISITFDCAWGAGDIPDILNTLRNEDVKATFFMVGQWAEKFPQAVKLMSQDGHDIGNHSYSHLRMGSIDSGKIRSEISRCGAKLNEITGNKIELFRAPYGDYNNSVIRGARDLGYYTIQWDVDSLDWKPGISRQEILSRVMRKVKSGSIILFHNDTPHTSKILPEIIASLKREGYSIVPVSQLILRENYIIDFEGRQQIPKQ